jgi:hypothetical protein
MQTDLSPRGIFTNTISVTFLSPRDNAITFFCYGKPGFDAGKEVLTMPYEGQMNAPFRPASSARCLKLCKFNCLTQFTGVTYNDKTKRDASSHFAKAHQPGAR